MSSRRLEPRRFSGGSSEKETEAKRFLDRHCGAVADGAPLPPRLDRILSDELATDLRAFYTTTGRRRLAEVKARLHYLGRFFRHRRAPANEAVRHRLPADLQVAVAMMHTYAWREREVLTLERRQLDRKAGTLRLDPGTTKNSEGRVVYLTPALEALLAAQVERVDALQRQVGRIVPAVFPHGGAGARAGEARRGFGKRAGRRRARPPGCRGTCSTTSGAPRCGTSSAVASRVPSP